MDALGDLRTQHAAVVDVQKLVRESNANLFQEIRTIGGALVIQNALLSVS